MKIIETNTDTMQNDVRSVENMLAELGRDMQNLISCADRIAGMWTGDANDVYEAELRTELTELSELVRTVQELNNGTESARGRYVDCEANVAGIIESIGV
ncbi:MAG: hypothetical protein J6D46_00790 [Lachnospiraceae bacterium]|nr:hypothetical protein [Lachnospiraceae bacterium]